MIPVTSFAGKKVAVFGLGGIGLNVIQGAKMVGADKIVGVDINDSKEDWGRRFGMTHFVNPAEVQGDLVPYLVDLTKGGSHTAEYLALNPTGRTPVLADGEFKLWESTAIMQYVASRKPNSLWPDDGRVRADIMRWQSWHLVHWSRDGCEPLLFQRLVKKLFNMGPPDETVAAKGIEAFHKEAKVLEAHLTRQHYLAGMQPTLADFSVAAPLFHAEAADFPLKPYPRIQEWFARISALPCWRETAPQAPAAGQPAGRAAPRTGGSAGRRRPRQPPDRRPPPPLLPP